MGTLKLSPRQEQILVALNDAHRNGAIEVPFSVLSKIAGISLAELADDIAVLIGQGLLDRLELKENACLSATGFRYARAIKSGSHVAAEGESLSIESEKSAIRDSLADTSLFLANLTHIVDNFPDAVDDSTIALEDKVKLKQLCAEFFGHPAAAELLRRALSRRARS